MKISKSLKRPSKEKEESDNDGSDPSSSDSSSDESNSDSAQSDSSEDKPVDKPKKKRRESIYGKIEAQSATRRNTTVMYNKQAPYDYIKLSSLSVSKAVRFMDQILEYQAKYGVILHWFQRMYAMI
jgi:hypothetical protein